MKSQEMNRSSILPGPTGIDSLEFSFILQIQKVEEQTAHTLIDVLLYLHPRYLMHFYAVTHFALS